MYMIWYILRYVINANQPVCVVWIFVFIDDLGCLEIHMDACYIISQQLWCVGEPKK